MWLGRLRLGGDGAFEPSCAHRNARGGVGVWRVEGLGLEERVREAFELLAMLG